LWELRGVKNGKGRKFVRGREQKRKKSDGVRCELLSFCQGPKRNHSQKFFLSLTSTTGKLVKGREGGLARPVPTTARKKELFSNDLDFMDAQSTP
jgi:hypothetical protein